MDDSLVMIIRQINITPKENRRRTHTPVARDIERATVVASVSLPSTPRGPHGKGLPSTCHHASLCLSDPSPIIPIRLSPTRLESVAEAKQSKANAAQSRAKADADTAPSASLSSLSLSLASVASLGSLVGPPLPSQVPRGEPALVPFSSIFVLLMFCSFLGECCGVGCHALVMPVLFRMSNVFDHCFGGKSCSDILHERMKYVVMTL
ncbi:hypothetical protein GW17_00010157 [Ensete ventricosum]|nr:hypothetical protein GW17_00010157 [Ensete ventricosum]